MDQIKFISTDMDGTLLNSNKELPSDFYQVYEKLAEKGIIFAAASGRQYQSLEQTFYPIKDKIVFISDNGTLVMYQGKAIDSTVINKDEIHNFINAVRQIDKSFIVVSGKKSAYIETQNPEAVAEISNYYHRLSYVPDLLAVDDEFIKISILHFESTAENVYPIVAPLFSNTHQVVVSSQIWLDFMHKEASKGAAIKKLQQYFGFSYEESMSFGDYLNDVEMLQETYHSYAMENAHSEIKALARFIAPSNDSEGVTTIIKEKVLRI